MQRKTALPASILQPQRDGWDTANLANFWQNDVNDSAPKRIWAGKTSDEEILAGTLLVFGLEAQGDWAGLRGGNFVDTQRATSRRRPAPHSRPTGSAAIPTSSPFA
jgi:hypothetical protein